MTTKALIIKVICPKLHHFLTREVVPAFVGFFQQHLDGECDKKIHALLSTDGIDQYVSDTYGKDRKLTALIFYNLLPHASVCAKLKNKFKDLKLILFSYDIHDGRRFNVNSLKNTDWIISGTHPKLFQNFFKYNADSKIIHFGNRCSDEFLQDQPNFSSIDRVFYYGREYPIRKDFLHHAGKDWNIVKHRRSGSKTTANELYRYTYAYTSGFDYFAKYKASMYYLVAKVFEIMGSGCLLLLDHRGLTTQLKDHGIIEGVHYLNINKDISADVRKFVQNNPEKVKEIRIRGHELVKSQYTIRHACEKINEKLRTLGN